LAQNPEYSLRKLEILNQVEICLTYVLETKACFSLRDLAINGKDLIAAGMKEGKEIGFTLNLLLENVINNEVQNDKSSLLNFLKQKEIL
jgi:tRNA nucleotidyltransferase (CCA-adding enzyme)